MPKQVRMVGLIVLLSFYSLLFICIPIATASCPTVCPSVAVQFRCNVIISCHLALIHSREPRYCKTFLFRSRLTIRRPIDVIV